MEGWLAALIGAIIGGIVTFMATFFTLRFNYKELFAKTVSATREKWLCIFRENLSKFLACAEVLVNRKGVLDDCKIIGYKKEFYEARAMMLSRLNLEEELHVLMFEAITKIKFSMSDFNFCRDYLLEVSRKFLKVEWERVKDEARGKIK